MAARGSAAWRRAAWGEACVPQLHKLLFLAGVAVWIDRRCREAFRAMACVVLYHGYSVRAADTGAYNCRVQKGADVPSAHAWATAIDINWLSNPYRRDRLVTDMPRAMVRDVLAVRTRGGVQVFRWGGDWDGRPDTPHSNYDAMHFEVIATPAELAMGIDWGTVKMPARDPARPGTWPVLEPGDRGPTVMEVQRRLGAVPDGVYGPKTRLAVEGWSRGLKPDGVVGLGTWTALLTGAPTVAA